MAKMSFNGTPEQRLHQMRAKATEHHSIQITWNCKLRPSQ